MAPDNVVEDEAVDMKEALAELAHSQWSGWIKYMFSKCEKTDDGRLIIPKWAVDRWTRQAHASYSELSEDEKDSDRTEADKFLAIFNKEKQNEENTVCSDDVDCAVCNSNE
jgi:hypothetical protein